MKSQVNSQLFYVLHSSFIREIIKKNPKDYSSKLLEYGENIGRRIVDDFCASNLIFQKIHDTQIEKYITLFFTHYFEIQIEIKENTILLKNDGWRFESDCSKIFLSGILSGVFQFLNKNTNFYVLENQLKFEVPNKPV